MQTIVAVLLVGVSSLMGVKETPPMPKVEIITLEQCQEKNKAPCRGYYEKGVVYVADVDEKFGFLNLEELTTLAHELAHWVQDCQGRIPEKGTKMTVELCEVMFKIEMEALDVEDVFRRSFGMIKADRFAYYIMRSICLSPDGM